MITMPVEIEKLYRGILAAFPEPCVLTDAAGNFLLINEAFSATFGYRLDEISTIATWWQEAYPDPEYRRWVERERARLITGAPKRGGILSEMELRIRAKDGRDVIAISYGSLLADSAPAKYLITLRDITSQREAEKKSQMLRERLERTEQIAGIGGWEHDLITDTQTWTPGNYLVHELDPEGGPEAITAYIREMAKTISPEHRAAYEAAVTTGTPYEVEFPCVTAKGRSVWLLSRSTSVMRDGKVVALVGHTQDITARKRAEEYNKKLLERLERTEKVALVGSWEYYLEDSSTIWTPGTYLIYDVDPNDHTEFEKHLRFLQGSQSPALAAATAAAVERQEAWDLEIQTETAKGRKIWIHTHGEPVVRNGKVFAVIGHDQDISARKLSEDKLRAAQKMEAVGQLTAGIAHDFNNLLAVITANLELLSETLESEPKHVRRIDAALRASDRGAQLTQHLLAFGRNQVLSPQVHNLCEKVQENVRLLRRTLPGNIVLEFNADEGGDVWACVDEAQLANALLNLGLNARDAMPNGGTLSFSVTSEHLLENDGDVPPGHYAAVSVQDSGVGIAKDIMGRVFDPFFSTKSVGQGSGLGLSMVYGFVRQSGGYVQLISEVGHGTTFILLFPLGEKRGS